MSTSTTVEKRGRLLEGGFRQSKSGQPQSQDIHRCCLEFAANDTDYLRSSDVPPGQLIGIANEWTIAMWVKPDDVLTTGHLLHIYANTTRNRISFALNGAAQQGRLSVDITDWNQTDQRKVWFWNSFFDWEEVWTLCSVTWDGTDLVVYKNGVDFGVASVKNQNGSVTQTDGLGGTLGREIGIPDIQDLISFNDSARGRYHSCMIWDEVLDVANQRALYNQGDATNMDLRVNTGNYTEAKNLKHWYRLGLDTTTSKIGEDHGGAPTLINISDDAANVTASNVRADAPTGVSIDLDGTNDYLANTTDQTIGIANAWTVAVWMKPRNITSSDRIVSFEPNATSESSIRLYMQATDNNRLVGEIFDSGGSLIKQYTWSDALENDLWNHIVWTWDGTDLLAYTRGIELTATKNTDNSGTMTDTSREVVVGIYKNLSGDRMEGQMHSIAVWDSALDDDEVDRLYNGGNKHGPVTSLGGGPVHWWRCGQPSSDSDFVADEGSGTAIDIAANAPFIDADDLVIEDSTKSSVGGQGDACFLTASNMGYLRSDINTTQSFGIANEWSISLWVKPIGSSTGFDGAETFIDIPSDDTGSGNTNRILFTWNGSNNAFRVQLWDSSDTAFRDYFYQRHLFGLEWIHLIVTWDGTDLELYVNGQLTAEDFTVTDNAGTMTDTTRLLTMGALGSGGNAFDAVFGHIGMFKKALTANDAAQIFCGRHHFDLSRPFGNYDNSSLVHYWKPGEDTNDLGRDYIPIPSNRIDIDVDSGSNADFNDIVNDGPAGVGGFRQSDFSVDFATNERITGGNEAHDIANAWTVSIAFKLEASNTDDMVPWELKSSGSANSQITLSKFNTIDARIELYDSSGTLFKDYSRASQLSVGDWTRLTFTWDGTDLTIYSNFTDVTSSWTKNTDDSGTMANDSRVMTFGSTQSQADFWNGRIHHLAMWDVALDADAVSEIIGTSATHWGEVALFDLNKDFGDYDNSGDLQAWYKLGFDITRVPWNYGTNFADNGNDVVLESSSNMGITDRVEEAPPDLSI